MERGNMEMESLAHGHKEKMNRQAPGLVQGLTLQTVTLEGAKDQTQLMVSLEGAKDLTLNL